MTQEHNGHNGHTVQEAPQIHEELHPSADLIGMQARLLLGNTALNPDIKTLPPVSEAQLQPLETRDYSPLQNASDWERATYWNNEQTLNAAGKKQKWAENFGSEINKKLEFYEHLPENDPRRETGLKWKGIFTVYGLQGDNITEAANQFYDRFLSNKSEENTMKGFIKKAVELFSPNNEPYYQALQEFLPMIRWLAHVYGQDSAEVVEQMILAEFKNMTPLKDEFLQGVNATDEASGETRLNRLDDEEKRLLRFICDHKDKHANLGAVMPTGERTAPLTQNQQPNEESHEQQTQRSSEQSQTEPASQGEQIVDNPNTSPQTTQNEESKQQEQNTNSPTSTNEAQVTKQRTEHTPTFEQLLTNDRLKENRLAQQMYQEILDAIKLGVTTLKNRPDVKPEVIALFEDELTQFDSDKNRNILLTQGKEAAFTYRKVNEEGVTESYSFLELDKLANFLFETAEKDGVSKGEQEKLKTAAVLINTLIETA